ncbi:MAG TPA: 4a-hydroxytetrahydrobiopterin dehydratase [Anaerolineales bacterium]|nr:4a-hydroxytetrahydrobiopterin dehydratase [Anaerolineales bacterium]
MSAAMIADLLPGLPEWQVIEIDSVKRLERVFRFPDFATAMAFTDAVGQIAEAEDHHPRLVTEWGRVTVHWWTHKIRGLHQNDFIMASKTDRVARPEA